MEALGGEIAAAPACRVISIYDSQQLESLLLLLCGLSRPRAALSIDGRDSGQACYRVAEEDDIGRETQ